MGTVQLAVPLLLQLIIIQAKTLLVKHEIIFCYNFKSWPQEGMKKF